MIKKDVYVTPEMDIVRFEVEDIITTSGDDVPELPEIPFE